MGMKSMNNHFGAAYGVSPIGERGQAVIPKKIREMLALKPGEDLIFFCQGKAIMALPAKKLQGFAKEMASHAKKIEKIAKKKNK